MSNLIQYKGVEICQDEQIVLQDVNLEVKSGENVISVQDNKFTMPANNVKIEAVSGQQIHKSIALCDRDDHHHLLFVHY